MKSNVKSRDCIRKHPRTLGVFEKWNGTDWGFFFLLSSFFLRDLETFLRGGGMGSGNWKHFFVWPNQERIKQKTLNHPVYLRMCVMQKMLFTAWTESGCVAGRLKSSLPRATEKVSVRLPLVSPNVVSKVLGFIQSFSRLKEGKGPEWAWRISSLNYFLCMILSTLAKKSEI